MTRPAQSGLRMASNSVLTDALDATSPSQENHRTSKRFFQMAAPGFFVSISRDFAKKRPGCKKLVIGQELSAVRQFSEFIIRSWPNCGTRLAPTNGLERRLQGSGWMGC